ncbi:kinesin-like protein KIN-4C [Alnus glutinosa]|uniref:kinesin-like protein KIN-4C n=1 Tax=Alnus glutinosa TaxID=3517 RepID=UPI002D786CD4|nr:kinesin-like protein KIN-4C [Alnus glutinosa]
MKKTNRRSKQASPGGASPSAPDNNQKQHYEERVHQLQQENNAFQKENEELRKKLENVSSTPNVGVLKLKEDYLQKLNVLEEQVTELKKKQNVQSQLSTQRPKGDEATKRLQFEIQSLKAQKVQMQCKIKLQSVQFRLCKTSLEKEVLQLRKEGRRNENEMQKLFASNQRLKMVLQRKTEEASMATKRLKELLESRKALSHKSAGARGGNIPRIQSIEHELDVTTRLHELCSEYERQMEEMAEEVAKLKEEAEMLKQENYRCPLQEKEVDCLEKDLDIKDLKEQVVSLSGLLAQLKIQKAELNHRDKLQDDLSQPSFSLGSSDELFEGPETSESENFGEAKIAREKSAVGKCCSCSKKSLCKTSKCRCRSTGDSCGKSCGCALTKCTNREAVPVKLSNSPQSETAESILNCLDIVETERTGIVASQGAMLLQGALAQKPAEMNNNRRTRKEPLCDIGNTLIESDALKPRQTKKGRKPVIQLVAVDPPSSLPENIEGPKEADILVKLPGPVPPAVPHLDDLVVSKATGVPAARYPVRQARALNQKENHSL